jgi:hypothetical protein
MGGLILILLMLIITTTHTENKKTIAISSISLAAVSFPIPDQKEYKYNECIKKIDIQQRDIADGLKDIRDMLNKHKKKSIKKSSKRLYIND